MGSVTIPPDYVPFDAAYPPSSSPGGAATGEPTQPIIFQSPKLDVPDNDEFPPIPDSPPSFDPTDHLSPTSPQSPTEGAITTNHSSLSPTEGASSTTAPQRSQRSTAGLPPDPLSLLAYDASHHIQRPTLPGSTQTVFCANSGQKIPKVSGEKIQNSYLANLQWSSL